MGIGGAAIYSLAVIIGREVTRALRWARHAWGEDMARYGMSAGVPAKTKTVLAERRRTGGVR
jgi:hypothetical protein